MGHVSFYFGDTLHLLEVSEAQNSRLYDIEVEFDEKYSDQFSQQKLGFKLEKMKLERDRKLEEVLSTRQLKVLNEKTIHCIKEWFGKYGQILIGLWGVRRKNRRR